MGYPPSETDTMASPDEVLATVRDALDAGDLELAEKTLRDASRNWKREPEFAIRHANILARLGRHAQALKVYRKAMKKAPERLDACKGAAECAIQVGNGKLAERLYSRATGLGLSLDEAALGISRSLIIRSQHHQAWDKALIQFNASGNKSKDLHSLLKEISAQVGSSVPQLDQYDSLEIDFDYADNRAEMSDVNLSDNSYEAGSIEAMAGLDRNSLLDSSKSIDDEILIDSTIGSGKTNLGIDLSALNISESEIQDNDDFVNNSDEESKSENKSKSSFSDSLEGPDELESSDDPFDDWPDV